MHHSNKTLKVRVDRQTEIYVDPDKDVNAQIENFKQRLLENRVGRIKVGKLVANKPKRKGL